MMPITKALTLMTGIMLISYTTATSGSQLFHAFMAGICLGLYVRAREYQYHTLKKSIGQDTTSEGD